MTLAVAVSDSPRGGAHAFVVVPESSGNERNHPQSIRPATYLRKEFHVWASAFRRRGQAVQHHLIDATPRKDRSDRDLGLTAWLPDLPRDIERFPSHEQSRSSMPAEGSTVIVGSKGSGKSTLALLYAQEAGGGRGWFLTHAADDLGADVGGAVTAASFMPAEEVTVGWVAEAQFGGVVIRAQQAVRKAAELGLLEYSRRSLGPRDDYEMPLWMHRLVRASMRELREQTDADAGLRVLACHRQGRRPQRYSAAELDELSGFLDHVAVPQRSRLFAEAAAAVMDILEPRGGGAVKSAGKLAAEALPFLDGRARDYADVACTCLMARARVVNQDRDASKEDIEKAIGYWPVDGPVTRGG